MSVDLTRLVNLQGLVKFKQRQDAENAATYVAQSAFQAGKNGGLNYTDALNNVYHLLEREDLVKNSNTSNIDVMLQSSQTVSLLTTESDLDVSKLDGVIDISHLPPSALERLIYVDLEEPDQEQPNKTSRLGLTTNDVQLGDTVKVVESGKMYMVVDTTKLNLEDGYEVYTAGGASSVPWSGVTNKPTIGDGSSYDIASGDHTHGSISNDGKIGSAADLPVITGTAGAVTVGNWATGANATSGTAFVNGADSRLSDTRDPNDHASNKVTAMTGYSKPVSLTSGHEAIETTDSLNAAIGKLENKVDANATAIAADIASSKVSAMTGYSKPNALTSGHEAIETTDTLNAAIGKLEYKVDADIASNKVSAMTGYSKPNSLTSGHEAVELTDTLNQAVGKLEYKLDAAIANVATDAEIDEEIFGIVAQNNGD